MIHVTYEMVAQRGGRTIVKRTYWFDSEKEREDAINKLQREYPEMFDKIDLLRFKVRGDL